MGQLDLLDERLTPASADQLTPHLHILFASLPIQGGADPQAAVAGYLVALEGRPEWAVRDAVRRVLRGEVEHMNLKFCPRPPELAQVVQAVMKPVHDDLRRKRDDMVHKALAKPTLALPTAEEKQRVAAIYERFKSSLPAETKAAPALDGDFWAKANAPLRPVRRAEQHWELAQDGDGDAVLRDGD